MLLVVLRIPPGPDAAATAATATGLALADVGRRLVGPLPRIIMVDPDRAVIESAQERLQTGGFMVAACDPDAVPEDDDRIVSRKLGFVDGGLVAHDGQGTPHVCPKNAIFLFQRGVRIAMSTKTTKETTRKLDVGRAILSGGLLLSKKTTTSTTQFAESRESFLVIHRNDGEPDIIVYERGTDYRVLGSAMQASSFANLEALTKQIAALAPKAPVDARIGRPGFVNGLTLTSANPVDLAIYLVALAHRSGAS